MKFPGIGILGDGLITMTNRITYFIYNKSRQPCNSLRRKLFEVIDSEVDSDNPKKKKRLPGSSFLKDNYACAKWQPSEFPEGETKESQEVNRKRLIQENAKTHQNDQKITYAMKLTFVSQRLAINKAPKVQTSTHELLTQWPFLRKPHARLT